VSPFPHLQPRSRGYIGPGARYGRIQGLGTGDLLPREPDGIVKGKTDGRREAR